PEVERLLRMIEKVVRYQTILVDENVDPAARPDQVDESMLEAISEIHTPVYTESESNNNYTGGRHSNYDDFNDDEEDDFDVEDDKE
ncbi:hypothetical protein KJ865_08555, partial [Myxococcota bacterium]|nr:hypothetical protein [Myxococcota bacterium]